MAARETLDDKLARQLNFRRNTLAVVAVIAAFCAFRGGASAVDAEELRPVALKAKVSNVQPMTGIVLWSTNEAVRTAPIQLEYS